MRTTERMPGVTYTGDTIEVSRRIKSGQRKSFNFLKTLSVLTNKQKLQVRSHPDEVRVNLVSRADNVRRQHSGLTEGNSQNSLNTVFDIGRIATLPGYSEVTLGEPDLAQLGYGWSAVVMPIVASSVDFAYERRATTQKIDEVLGTMAPWKSHGPAVLQVVEMKVDDQVAHEILAYVAAHEPPQCTELFDASVRLRHSL